MAETSYVLASGRKGRERLRVVARVFGPATSILFDEIGVEVGMACLDVGSGGGDVSTELARRVGSTGRVLGIDMDPEKLEIAKSEAAENKLHNIEFQELDVFGIQDSPAFDIVYSRFLLTHLTDPAAALASMLGALRSGGVIALEDIDFSGHFCSPECSSFRDYVRLYSEAARARGVDPDIGQRLPVLLREAGLGEVFMNVSQPADIDGEAKFISPITMESVGETVVTLGLASESEVARIVGELYEVARDDQTVLSTPRIVQAWGKKH